MVPRHWIFDQSKQGTDIIWCTLDNNQQTKRTRDPQTGGSNPACVRSTIQMWETFFRVKNVVLPRCRCARPPCAYIRTHKNVHVRTLKIPQSTSEFGGLWKHEKIQHAFELVRVGYRDSVAVGFPGKKREIPMGTTKCTKYKQNNQNTRSTRTVRVGSRLRRPSTKPRDVLQPATASSTGEHLVL